MVNNNAELSPILPSPAFVIGELLGKNIQLSGERWNWKSKERQDRKKKTSLEGKYEGGVTNWKNTKNIFSCCEEVLSGWCHAIDGFWEFFCRMMTVALVRREQPEFKFTHYEFVCACLCWRVRDRAYGQNGHCIKVPVKHILPCTFTLEHNSIHSSNRILYTLQEPLELWMDIQKVSYKVCFLLLGGVHIRGNPYPIQSNLFLFVSHRIQSHLGSQMHEAAAARMGCHKKWRLCNWLPRKKVGGVEQADFVVPQIHYGESGSWLVVHIHTRSKYTPALTRGHTRV